MDFTKLQKVIEKQSKKVEDPSVNVNAAEIFERLIDKYCMVSDIFVEDKNCMLETADIIIDSVNFDDIDIPLSLKEMLEGL